MTSWRKYTAFIESYALQNPNAFWVSHPVITLFSVCFISSLISNIEFFSSPEKFSVAWFCAVLISMLTYLLMSVLFIIIRFGIERRRVKGNAFEMPEVILTMFSVMALISAILIPIMAILG